MNSGLYAAATGLIARTQALEIVANNLANAGSAGYKADLPFYKLVQRANQAEPMSSAVNAFGALGGARTRWSEGAISSTGSPTDIALRGPGLLAVQTQQGLAYTRAGNLHLDANRRLVTVSGDAILGAGGPITLPEGKLTISESGELAVDGAIFEQLRMVELKEGTQPSKLGQLYFSADQEAVRPATDTKVLQGQLESANLSGVEGTVQLIGVQRQAEMLTRALNIFHNDFNRSAAEEIARV